MLDEGETLIRFGSKYETADALEEQAHRALEVLGIHGVSVTAGDLNATRSSASAVSRRALERSGFSVHDTPTRRNPNHRTVELPHPVSARDAERFNSLLGRGRIES